MRFIIRTLFHTRPGERDQAVAAIKQMVGIMPPVWGTSRILTAVFTSDTAPDILWEGEVQADSFMEAMHAEEALYSNTQFQAVNAELVKHLTRAAKSELYLLEE